MVLSEGTPLQNETYVIIQELGRGGMGVTYLAEHKALQQTQVIKVLDRDVNNEAARQQFELEAQLLAAVDRHPNLPVVHNYFVEHDRPFLVMEYIQGQSLQDRCNDDPSPGIEDILRWTKDLLAALVHLHQRNVIHRDIKPANIIIRPDGTAVLLDFGLARRLDHSHTRTGAQGISAHFAPIEQYDGDNRLAHLPSVRSRVEKFRSDGFHTGPYSDIYSLGATLYFALTLNLPNDALYRLQDDSLPLLDTTAPERLSTAVAKAMAVEPRDRFQSATEMLDFLKPLLEAGREQVSTEFIPFQAKQARPRDFMVENLPDIFVPRLTELERILGLLRESSKSSNKEGFTTVAIRGAGGYGKTTLAKAIAHDSRVHDQFPDGILWVTLGETPNLTHSMIKVLTELTGKPSNFVDLEDAAYQLAQALEKQRYLLILDDVWDAAHIRPFMRGGAGCVRLITTRQSLILPLELVQVHIAEMLQSEAVALLCAGIPDEEKLAQAEALHRLTVRLGRYPLLLKLANGVLRHRLNQGQPLAEALIFMEHALDKRGITAFDTRSTTDREQAVAHTLGLSFEMLESDEYTRFGELAVFPQDVDILLATVCRWWSVTGNLDKFEAEELCDRLFRLSLLLHFDLSNRVIRLHSVIRAYLVQQHNDSLPGWQAQFLDFYRPTTPSPLLPNSTSDLTWADLPTDEPYLWTNLAYHLVEARRAEELVATVKELRYLAVKSFVCGAYSVELDLLQAERLCLQDKNLGLLRSSFIQSSHLLNRSQQIKDLAISLFSRLQHQENLVDLLQRFEETLPRPYLKPRHPLPDIPHSDLQRTLTGHMHHYVDKCAINGDGTVVISAGWDDTIRVWNPHTGQETLSLPRQANPVNGCCSISRDGKTIVFASDQDTLKVYDLFHKKEHLTLSGLKSWVLDCAISADGTTIVAVAGMAGFRVWDAHTGEMIFTAMHPFLVAVSCCAINVDGTLAAIGLGNGEVAIWDIKNKNLQSVISLDRNRAVKSCSISSDGHIVAFTFSEENDVWVTDNHNKSTGIFRLRGHTDDLSDCAISSDGQVLVTASGDRTLKIWDVQRQREMTTLIGHSAGVNGCAIDPEGRTIVSVGSDHTVKIWDIGRDIVGKVISNEHRGKIQQCAISRDGQTIVSIQQSTQLDVWNGKTLKRIYSKPGNVESMWGCCDINNDGSRIVYATYDNKLMVLNYRKPKKEWVLGEHDNWVLGCAIDPEGNYAVSSSADNLLKVWDIRRRKLIHTLEGHKGVIYGCAISGDGSTIVSASADKTVIIWDAITGKVSKILKGHSDQVAGCAITNDKSMVVSASFDKTLKVWDTQSGVEIRNLNGHTDQVLGCDVSEYGLVVSAGADATVRVWDIYSGVCLTVLHVESLLTDCTFSADGQNLVAAGQSGVYFFRLVR